MPIPNTHTTLNNLCLYIEFQVLGYASSRRQQPEFSPYKLWGRI